MVLEEPGLSPELSTAILLPYGRWAWAVKLESSNIHPKDGEQYFFSPQPAPLETPSQL
jgi:hypothetical protein